MSYDFSIQLRRGVLARCSTAVIGASVDSPSDEPQQLATASEPTDRRLVTDGGDSESEIDDGEGEGEGADEEMQPPQQEGEAGVEQDATEEEANAEAAAGDEEMQPPEQEGEAGAEAEEEQPEEPPAEAEEAEAEPEADEEPEAAEEPDEEAEGETVDVPQSDVESVGAAEDESTTVVFLDIYGLDLDLLGLEIELHQVVLDVFATEGDGNLLGNLLSAVAGLTDPGGLSDLVPEGGLSGLLPSGGSITDSLGIGGDESETGEEGEESEGVVSSAASSLRESIPSLPIKQLLIEIIAGVIRQLLEPSEKQSGEEAAGEGS